MIVKLLSKNINPSLVPVQPRVTCPFITERLLMEGKESNKQTNKKQARLSLHLSECHIVGNHTSRLIYKKCTTEKGTQTKSSNNILE